LGTSLRRIIILLHAVHDCPGEKITAIARHVSFAQITCKLQDGSTTALLLLDALRLCIRDGGHVIILVSLIDI